MLRIPPWISWLSLCEHVIAGFWITAVLCWFGPAYPLVGALFFGLGHEVTQWDDLFTGPGHPYNGLLDILAFCVIPILVLI